MKVVVISGGDLFGSFIVKRLHHLGHKTLACSPRAGVDTLTGKSLDVVLSDTHTVIDATNAPSYANRSVIDPFITSTRKLLDTEKLLGVQHHIAISVVGAERLLKSVYLQAKIAQENLIKRAEIPYTILRSTQYFESIYNIINECTSDQLVRLSPALIQPIALDDIALVLACLIEDAPINGTIEVAGPDFIPLDEIARLILTAHNDKRQVIADVHACCFGSELNDRSLISGDNARIGTTHFTDWLDINFV